MDLKHLQNEFIYKKWLRNYNSLENPTIQFLNILRCFHIHEITHFGEYYFIVEDSKALEGAVES